MTTLQSLSAGEARRAALAAQGFADPRPSGNPGARALHRVLDRVGLFQIDSVNVLVRSHYLPAFSRLGAYRPELLERAAYAPKRQLFEYWAHEASLLPVDTQPFLRWRMAQAAEKSWGGMRRIAAEKPELVAKVRDTIAERGPMSAGELEAESGAKAPRSGPWWDWRESKLALEYLFWAGEVSTFDRRNFERRYDLTERVLPPEVIATPTPAPADAYRELIRRSARALGVATEPDLRDYFRLKPHQSKPAVAELVEEGALIPVAVEGWRDVGYLAVGARIPRRVSASALLSPFDSLIWFRPRTERLFGFHYRLAFYTPAPQRVHGYYVLPFLFRGQLVGRVDLKADRAAGVLRVPGAFGEPALTAPLVPPGDGETALPLPASSGGTGLPASRGATVRPGADGTAVRGGATGAVRGAAARRRAFADEAVAALAAELWSLAGWLGLEGVEVAPNGDLAAPLITAVG
ncbi:winged helix-turn-helix domain-containing protein [Cryptosporangium arvum]|uniref:winged helix-turn-helix domain-containing protein n=1 Tax=Cryptosporangium arvum TaxID=80871 RepID=UPI0012EE6C5D|nr:crosslink repair DNA glycosylase YcaQ family protein [Cryptosporangium arvum]